MLNAANIITFARMVLSAVLAFLSPLSAPFGVCYLLCGASDMADGFIARKTHTESEKGARLDSIADMVFFTVSAVKILPLVHLNTLLWLWTAVIAVIKITCMILELVFKHTFSPDHSVFNKVTGILLFIMPMTIRALDARYSAAVVCTAAGIAAVQKAIKLAQTRIRRK